MRLPWDETACERSDIYGLGLLLYELLTGNNPLLGLNPSEILHTQLRQTLPPPHKQLHIPKAAYSICQIATSPDPAARYGSVQDFLEACQNALRESLLQRAAPQMLP